MDEPNEMNPQPRLHLRIEKISEVMLRTGLSMSSVYAAVAAGTFPKPLLITKAAVGWRTDEVDAWIASRPRAEIGRRGYRKGKAMAAQQEAA
jgi:prophage regulatory protein